MSYKQIEIGGRLRGLKFSQGTNALLRDVAKAWSEQEQDAFGAYAIIWAALKANCIIKGEQFTKTVDNPEYNESDTKSPKVIEVPATLEDVCDWADKLHPSVYLELLDIFNSVNGFKVDEPETVVKDEEKKSETVNTNSSVTDLPLES